MKKIAFNLLMACATLFGATYDYKYDVVDQESQNIQMIAMGAFSHNRLRDKLFGSFTAKMIAGAKVPLLLLR